jgi:hypothetical protein
VDTGDFSRAAKTEVPLTTVDLSKWLLVYDRSLTRTVEVLLQVTRLLSLKNATIV